MSNPFVLNPSPDLFRQACNQGNVDAIKEYIKEKNPDSFTLSMGLKHAAAADQIKVVRYFLENGVHIDDGTLRFIQSPEVWEVFLSNGVELNPVNRESPLMEVITHNDPALLRWFLTKDTKAIPERALQVAASKASTESIDILIEHGAQVRDSMAMHYALFRDSHDSRIGMMEHLLQHGTGVNNFGDAPGIGAGGTPLFAATKMSGLDLVAEVQWLLDHGADPRIRDELGRLAIQYALHSKQVREILREQGNILDSLEAGEEGLAAVN